MSHFRIIPIKKIPVTDLREHQIHLNTSTVVVNTTIAANQYGIWGKKFTQSYDGRQNSMQVVFIEGKEQEKNRHALSHMLNGRDLN